VTARPSASDAGTGDARLAWVTRLLPKTLATRLVVGVVSLVVLLSFLMTTSTYFAMRIFLYHRLDQQVEVAATQNAAALNNAPTTGFITTVPLIYSGQKVWLNVLGPSGATVDFRLSPFQKQFEQLPLTPSQRERLVARAGRIVAIEDSNDVHLRVESVPLLDGNVLVVGLSSDEIRRTMREILLAELAIAASAIVVAAAITWWGVGVGLRPLSKVTRTARTITEELSPDGTGLDRRVPGADSHTEVGQVAEAVNTLLQAVETQFAARVASEVRMRQFLADASHELRTPLTSIRGYAELSRLQGRSNGDAEDPMNRIEAEGTRMSRLVEDLLVLTRGEQGTPSRREVVEVDALLDDALSGVVSAYPNRTFVRGEDPGVAVVGDPDQLTRLLINLLTNAAIHTADGPITIDTVPNYLPSGQAIDIRVIDHGPGLPPDEAAHVFERFWRADKARTRAKGGSGLGMSIVAQLVHANGGVVRFDSAVATGTTVTVTLPLASGD
jgi:two-component system OmpR family sensor kinase